MQTVTQSETYQNEIGGLDQRISTAESKLTPEAMETTIENSEALSEVRQTADKINWIVESGTSSSNMTLTDDALNVISEGITLTADKINLVANDINLSGNFSVNTIVSNAVDPLETDIDSLTTRVTQAETAITQNAEQIELRATKTEVQTVATAASNAQSAADAAQSAATGAQGTANAAQSAASAAQTAADNAASAAQTAQGAADAAQSTADAAQSAADSAQEGADFATPLTGAEPPEEAPAAGKLWIDEGQTPSVWRRWRGADVPTDRQYEETVSGDADSPAFVSIDNAQGQLQEVELEVGCVAQQAGTGDPSPSNIRTISGRESVEVTACGKNLMPYTKPSPSTYTNNGITYTWNDDGSIHVVGTQTGNSDSNVIDFEDFYLPPGKYRMIASGVSGVSPQIVVKKANTGSNFWYKHDNIIIESGDIPQYFYVYVRDVGTVDTVVYAFLSYGTESPTADDYEPYTPMGGGVVTPSEPLYGLPDAEDTVEVDASGDVTVTRRTAVVELDGTENWGNYTGSGVQDGFLVPTLVFADANMGFQTSKCSHFKNVNWAWVLDTPWVYSDHETQLHKYFVVPKSQIADIAAWKSWLAAQKAAGTPVTIVYELATPTPITATGGQQIDALAGVNTVITDGDSVTATGRADPVATVQALADRVAALEQAAVNSINNTTEG